MSGDGGKAEAAEKVTAGLILKSETAEIFARVEKTSHVGGHDEVTALLLKAAPELREEMFVALEKADAALRKANAALAKTRAAARSKNGRRSNGRGRKR